MAKMISQAGEMAVTLKNVSAEGNDLVITGQMGVWDSKIIVPPGEVLSILKLMLRPAVIAFVLKAPFRKQLNTDSNN